MYVVHELWKFTTEMIAQELRAAKPRYECWRVNMHAWQTQPSVSCAFIAHSCYLDTQLSCLAIYRIFCHSVQRIQEFGSGIFWIFGDGSTSIHIFADRQHLFQCIGHYTAQPEGSCGFISLRLKVGLRVVV